MAPLAEETGIYFKDADPIQNLEHLTEITDKATRFRLPLHFSSDKPRTGTNMYQLTTSDGISPDLFGRAFFGHLSSTTDDTSMRTWALDHVPSS